MSDEGTCASCAKTETMAFHDKLWCLRKNGKFYDATWPDATCPAWQRRRDKLDERIEELLRTIRSVEAHPLDSWRCAMRLVLERWAAEDKEAK